METGLKTFCHKTVACVPHLVAWALDSLFTFPAIFKSLVPRVKELGSGTQAMMNNAHEVSKVFWSFLNTTLEILEYWPSWYNFERYLYKQPGQLHPQVQGWKK